MFSRSLRFSLCLDHAIGGTLLLIGICLTLADALGRMNDGTGSVGLGVIALGMLLCINAMLRGLAAREAAAFDLGREAGLRMVKQDTSSPSRR